MKTIWFWLVAAVLAIAALWYYVKTKPAPAQAAGGSPNAGTATGANGWWPGLLGLTNTSLKNGNLNSTAAMNELTLISNAFGSNDGGRSTVAVGGSSAGGVQSSGAGAGVPSASQPPTVDNGDPLAVDDSNPGSATYLGDTSDSSDQYDF